MARMDLSIEVNRWRSSVARYARARQWVTVGNRYQGIAPSAGMMIFARALPDGDRRIIFAEVVDETVPLSECQELRVQELLAVSQLCRGRVEVFVWRPHDRKQVVEVLR